MKANGGEEQTEEKLEKCNEGKEQKKMNEGVGDAT